MNAFEQLQNLTKEGFWSDNLRIDRIMIESHTCPTCWKPLQYQGFSNVSEYRAYGVCQPCGFVKRFWTETADLNAFKKKILNQISAANVRQM